MQPIQPSYFSASPNHWSEQQWTRFSHLMDPSWLLNPPAEKELQIAINILGDQEKEILYTPEGGQLLSAIPANANNPLFYFKREQWLNAYNKVEFWKMLPGGKEFIASKEALSVQELAPQLAEWMIHQPAVLNVEHLLLHGSSLTRIPEEIGLLSRLIRLHIVNAPITKLPPQFGNLVRLTDVMIFNTQIRHLCPEFKNLQSLKKLQLRNNQLVEIEPLSTLKNLHEINVLGNQITKLPDQLEWPKLKIITLCYNRLSDFPKALYGLTNLRLILCTYNQISHLSDQAPLWPELDSIFLGGNQFHEFPLSLCTLPKLRTISIQENHLKSLPIELNNMPALKEIVCTNNCLQEKPSYLRMRVAI